jgi:hypothetical protein
MESAGAPGRVNVSRATYELVKHVFECEYRGRVEAKGKGEVEMFFVNGERVAGSSPAEREVGCGEYGGRGDERDRQADELGDGPLGVEVAGALRAAP